MGNKSLSFKVSSHLKNIIGRDLVTDKYVAIFELVKNSVDAKAKKIEVIISEDQIIIKDDGKGMTLEDIENKWFFIGYSEKKDSEELYAGSKGIGRFSADNLAKELRIETKCNDSNAIELNVNWELFEKDQTNEIKDIQIPYIEKDFDLEVGTTLILNDLRNKWDRADLKKLRRALEKIENPFEEKKEVQVTLITEYEELSGVIANTILEVLDEKSIVVDVRTKDSVFTCKLSHNGKKVAEFSYKQETVLNDVRFKLYHLSKAAKSNFTRRMGVEFTNYGNIFVYRNGFRVYPYGEIDFDIFGLNLRKSQGYNRYLGTRDIIGSISIIDKNDDFKEVTSRDNGFVSNVSYLELQNVYMEYHRFLEDFMKITLFNATMNYEISENVIRRFRKKNDFKFSLGKTEDFVKFDDVVKKISKDVPLTNQEKKVVEDERKKSKIESREVAAIKQENKTLTKNNVDLKKEISVKNVLLNTNDDNSSVDREMFNHHINTEINELKAIMDNFKSENEDIVKRASFIEFEEQYHEITQKLSAIKSIIFSLKERSIGKTENNIVQFIDEYCLKWSIKNKLRIDVFTNDISHVKKYDIIYLVIVLDNLFENAVKNNANKVDILFEEKDSELIVDILSRNSVDRKMILEKVFDFGYTTKRRGTGMGMFFVKKIVEEQFKSTVKVDIINKCDFLTRIRMR